MLLAQRRSAHASTAAPAFPLGELIEASSQESCRLLEKDAPGGATLVERKPLCVCRNISMDAGVVLEPLRESVLHAEPTPVLQDLVQMSGETVVGVVRHRTSDNLEADRHLAQCRFLAVLEKPAQRLEALVLELVPGVPGQASVLRFGERNEELLENFDLQRP